SGAPGILEARKGAEINNVHRKLPGTDSWVARIKINDFGRCSAVRGFSYEWPGVIAFVNVKIIVAEAGWIGATDDNPRLEPRPISRRARQSQRERIAVYAFDTGAFIQRAATNRRPYPIQGGATGIECSGTGLR